MFCASIGGRKGYLLKKTKLSPEASFELQPTKTSTTQFSPEASFELQPTKIQTRFYKRQKHRFNLRLPSKYT